MEGVSGGDAAMLEQLKTLERFFLFFITFGVSSLVPHSLQTHHNHNHHYLLLFRAAQEDREKLEKLRKEADDVKRELAESRKENNSLTSNLETLRNEKKSAEADLNNKLATLESQLQKSTRDKEESEKAKAKLQSELQVGFDSFL